MDKFDREIKQGVQSYLQENIKLSRQEIAAIQSRAQRKKPPINFLYISAFSLLTVIVLVLALPLFQSNQLNDFSMAPLSNKNGFDKVVPAVEDEDSNGDDSNVVPENDEVQSKQDDNVVGLETENEKEAIFLALIERYNEEIRGYELELDYEDEVELSGSIGYRLVGFETKADFFAQFSDFVTHDAAEKMFCLMGENEDGPFVIISEHCRSHFYTENHYELEKINDEKYQITQSYADFIDAKTLMFEFTKMDGSWYITDWDRISDYYQEDKYQYIVELEPLFLEFNQMKNRIPLESEQLQPLESDGEGYKIEGISTKAEFYSLFTDLMTANVAELIWDEWLVEEASGLYILPVEGAGYYPFETIEPGHHHQVYFFIDDNKIEVSQGVSHVFGNYENQFVVENTDGQWIITEWNVTFE